MDKTASDPLPIQLELLWASAVDRDTSALKQPTATARRHKLVVALEAFGPPLRALAQRRGTSMNVLIRQAVKRMLIDDAALPTEIRADIQPGYAQQDGRFNFQLPIGHAKLLIDRASAADMTRAEYVWALLKGMSPPALAPDHAQAIRTVLASTDRVALLYEELHALRTDLGRGRLPEKLEHYCVALGPLEQEARAHMKAASVLLRELKPYRRPRP